MDRAEKKTKIKTERRSEINVWPFQKINFCVIIWRHDFDLQDTDGHRQTEIV